MKSMAHENKIIYLSVSCFTIKDGDFPYET